MPPLNGSFRKQKTFSRDGVESREVCCRVHRPEMCIIYHALNTDYSRRPEAQIVSEIQVFVSNFMSIRHKQKLHSLSRVPVRVDAKTYRTYTIEDGEHVETSSFGRTHLIHAKTKFVSEFSARTRIFS